MTIRVILADDQPLLRMGFRMILNSTDNITVIGEAADGAEAVRLVTEMEPDVVLMDVRMPGLDGIEATRRIVRSGSHSQILILTTFDLDEYAFAGLRAGASGFLLKDVLPADLTTAIHAIASGDAVVSPRITRQLLNRYATDLPNGERSESTMTGADHLSRLTEREREVFGAIAAGLSNAEIAQELVLSEATVKTHVTRILGKLELRDRVQAVVFAYQHHLVDPNPGGAGRGG